MVTKLRACKRKGLSVGDCTFGFFADGDSQGRIPMLRGPRHMPGVGPPQHPFIHPLYFQYFPPPSCLNPSLILPFSLFSPFSFLPIYLSLFTFFLFAPFFPFLLITSMEHKKAPRGSAGPPEARGPRHVPFVPLWGSGTGLFHKLRLL